MIDKKEVEHIAKLARLELTEQEVEKMQKDLSSILDYFDLLKQVKAKKNVVHYKEVDNNLRKDEVTAKSSSLANNLINAAPTKKDDYIKVKQVLS